MPMAPPPEKGNKKWARSPYLHGAVHVAVQAVHRTFTTLMHTI